MRARTFKYLVTLNLFTSCHCMVTYIALSMALSYIFSNSILTFSFFTGLYLMAMGIGALLVERLDKDKTPLIKLLFHNSLAGILLASPGVIMILILNEYLHILLRNHQIDLLYLMFPTGILLTLCIGIVSGAELPVFSMIAEKEGLPVARPIITVLASDYFGAFVGIMLFTFILNPLMGLIQAITFSQALTLLVINAAYFSIRIPNRRKTSGLILILNIYVFVMFWHRDTLINFIDQLSAY